MRRFLPTFLLVAAAAVSVAEPDPPRERIAAYYGGWYAWVPGSEITVKPTKEVALPGLESFMVERKVATKSRQESNLVLFEPSSDEIFVGDVFGDPERAASNRPFEASRDLPNVEASVRDMFGLPVRVELVGAPRGPLLPLTVTVQLDKAPGASFVRPGFVSRDGSALLLGQFQALGESPAALRERLLSDSPGVRLAQGRFTVTEFLDFQCDRCRIRTPDVRRAVEQKGGTVEIYFLPLVKTHEWAFAAAESAAALAAVRPDLYRHYEEAMFARGEGMNPAAARELASDIAEAAGARAAFDAEVSTGRARARVARDAGLAMRLGIVSTPSFVYRGTYVPGERGALETFLFERLPAAGRATPRNP